MRIPAGVFAISFLLASCMAAPPATPKTPDDPVKVDPKHYKVEFENDQVRLLHATYGPHEKSPMHNHPDYAAVQVTEANARETIEGGKATESIGNPGVGSGKAMRHSLENLGDKPFETYILEFKKPK